MAAKNQADRTFQCNVGPKNNYKKSLQLGLRGQEYLRHNLHRVFGLH